MASDVDDELDPRLILAALGMARVDAVERAELRGLLRALPQGLVDGQAGEPVEQQRRALAPAPRRM